MLTSSNEDKIVKAYDQQIHKLKLKANKLKEKGRDDKVKKIEEKIFTLELKKKEATENQKNIKMLLETASCPLCGGNNISHIEVYNKFYCNNCQKYIDIV